MSGPSGWLRRRRLRQALAPEVRQRLDALDAALRGCAAEARREPLALARLVALDVETTGLAMHVDRVISIGAVAVRARTLRHDDAFERYLRQRSASPVANILIHRIGGQQQLAGTDPALAMLECLEFLGASVGVAFRAEFDRTFLRREAAAELGVPLRSRFIDLAVVLPALFPGTPYDTLEDWLHHFHIVAQTRHTALADAYAHAMLLLVVLEHATRAGLTTVGDLLDLEKAQRWLGKAR